VKHDALFPSIEVRLLEMNDERASVASGTVCRLILSALKCFSPIEAASTLFCNSMIPRQAVTIQYRPRKAGLAHRQKVAS
jgi:hypothetical protein